MANDVTLGDGKRKVLMLLDEYSSGGVPEIDEDIEAKMKDFFDIAQKDMAQWQPILRRTDVTLDGSGADDLPEDVSRVLCIRKNGQRSRGYEIIDGKILYAAGDTSTLTLDYYALPRTIPQDAGDDYEFEVSEEAANCMPFFLASQQLIPDLVVDYGAFYNLYQQMRAMVPRSAGTSGGSVRQALWR